MQGVPILDGSRPMDGKAHSVSSASFNFAVHLPRGSRCSLRPLTAALPAVWHLGGLELPWRR